MAAWNLPIRSRASERRSSALYTSGWRSSTASQCMTTVSQSEVARAQAARLLRRGAQRVESSTGFLLALAAASRPCRAVSKTGVASSYLEAMHRATPFSLSCCTSHSDMASSPSSSIGTEEPEEVLMGTSSSSSLSSSSIAMRLPLPPLLLIGTSTMSPSSSSSSSSLSSSWMAMREKPADLVSSSSSSSSSSPPPTPSASMMSSLSTMPSWMSDGQRHVMKMSNLLNHQANSKKSSPHSTINIMILLPSNSQQRLVSPSPLPRYEFFLFGFVLQYKYMPPGATSAQLSDHSLSAAFWSHSVFEV
mmetsp:Transcript_16773/g.39146  ORF Transcript_16773/g.39146 Transcript_16773/m.39146 type:complete len:305 (+) Transcript_16773:2317-3231(+)